jgi:hypothetical protein
MGALIEAFFLLVLLYGEDARTIVELSIEDNLLPNAKVNNISGRSPLFRRTGRRSAPSSLHMPPALRMAGPTIHDTFLNQFGFNLVSGS